MFQIGDEDLGTIASFGEFDRTEVESAEIIGVDSGSSLVKLCVRPSDPERPLYFATWPAPSVDRVLALLDDLGPTRVGLTGCGSAGLLESLGGHAHQSLEFDAWARGASDLLGRMALEIDGPYLLVSVGTGTSMLRVDGDEVERVGGTSLGGGALLGLGLALTGSRTHEELAELASRGDRASVDLLIGDIYGDAVVPLAAKATAASFGKLAQSLDQNRSQSDASAAIESPRKEDLAAAVMGLVSENIGWIAVGQARAMGASRIVYGGSTLHQSQPVVDMVKALSTLAGFEPVFLPRGGHAGALGAMLLAD